MVFRTVALTLVLAACAGDYAKPGVCEVGEARTCACQGGGPGLELCTDPAPAIWTSCRCDVEPVARVSGDGVVSYKQTVHLDGSLSFDPQGLPLSFAWTLIAVPTGSAAQLDDPAAATPSFFADKLGTYTIKLVASDGILTSAAVMTVVEARDDAPVLPLLADRVVDTGELVTLDASTTTDANDDPLTYAWTVTQRPAGSVAQVIAATGAVTSLTPDVPGAYEVTLAVEDGIQTAVGHLSITAYRPITPIAFQPSAAAYSRVLDRVVVVGSAGLAIVDAPGRTTMSLAVPGTAVAITADGLTAVVAADGKLTIVDLQTASIVRSWPVAASAISDVFVTSGVACAFPNDQTTIHCVDLTSGTDTFSIARNYAVRRHFDAAHTAAWGVLAATIAIRFDFSGGSPDPSGPAGFTISAGACDELWPTDDGARLIGACGAVYADPTPTDAGMLPIPGTYRLRSVASTASELVAIPIAFSADAPDDHTLLVHALPSLAVTTTIELPQLVANNAATPTHGDLVFTGPHGIRVLLFTTDGVYGVVAY